MTPDEIYEMSWELEQLKQARGVCSCGDSTILGVIHSDTRPCSLPIIHRPLTEPEVNELLEDYSDLGRERWEIVARIEKAHGIGGVDEV